MILDLQVPQASSSTYSVALTLTIATSRSLPQVGEPPFVHLFFLRRTRTFDVWSRSIGVLHGRWMFWNAQGLSSHNKTKDGVTIPRHKSWLAIGDSFIIGLSSSCVRHDFISTGTLYPNVGRCRTFEVSKCFLHWHHAQLVFETLTQGPGSRVWRGVNVYFSLSLQ